MARTPTLLSWTKRTILTITTSGPLWVSVSVTPISAWWRHPPLVANAGCGTTGTITAGGMSITMLRQWSLTGIILWTTTSTVIPSRLGKKYWPASMNTESLRKYSLSSPRSSWAYSKSITSTSCLVCRKRWLPLIYQRTTVRTNTPLVQTTGPTSASWEWTWTSTPRVPK